MSFVSSPANCRIASSGVTFYANKSYDIMTYVPYTPPPTPAPTPAPTNECNPTKTCNVCTACCESFIPDGAACDQCVESKCPHNECNPTKTCNVCAACCESFIPDGAPCDQCVASKC